MSERTLSKSEEFKGCLLTLEVHQVELEDGSRSVREIVGHPGAVCAVAITKDNDTILVRQYRKAVEASLLEIPAGKIDPGEDPGETVIRELREEIGYLSGRVRHVMDFFASPGFCNEKLGLYLAEDVELGPQQLDDGEFVELLRVPFAEAVAMALRGDLGDAKSVAGILAVSHLLAQEAS